MTRLNRVYGVACVVFALLTAAPSVLATTIVMPTDEALIEKTPVIVRGSVIETGSVEIDGGIWTETIVDVSEVLKGEAPEVVTIREVGGRIGDRESVVFGSPAYETGQTVLAFLWPSPRGDFQTMDLFLGKFEEEWTLDGQRLWVRPDELPNTQLLDANFEPIEARNVQRDALRFTEYVRDRAAGLAGDRSYGVSNPTLVREMRQNFTLIAEPKIYRWFSFEDGKTIGWQGVGAQPGYPDGGVTDTLIAMDSWSGYPEANIRYTWSGMRSGPAGGLDKSNGINEVIFNDPLGEIAGSWKRSEGGVVGRGGFNRISGSRNWKGPFVADGSHGNGTYSAYDIIEGNLVIQDGVSPANGLDSKRFAEILAHEFGHTLGFGHSLDSSALMYASVTGLGPTLRGDDQLSARWLYPVSGGETVTPIPAAPSNLTAQVIASGVARLAWSDQSKVETSHTVYINSGSGFAVLQKLGADATALEVSGLAAGKTYSFRVTASNSAGESSPSNIASLTVSNSLQTYSSLIPVSTTVAGAGGTSWRTDLTVFNASPFAAELNIVYLPAPGETVRTRNISIGSKRSQSWDNVLSDLFGISSGAGALQFNASNGNGLPDLRISSRTYTDSPHGTYGQFVGDVEGKSISQRLHVAGVVHTNRFRTNVGLVNRGSLAIETTLSLFAQSGILLGRKTLVLAPSSFQQQPLPALFPVLGSIQYDQMSLDIASDRPDSVTAYASIVDNISQDPVFITARPAESRSEIYVGAVGRTSGAAGTYWRSDVTLFNPGSRTVWASLRLLRSGQDNRAAGGRTLSIGPKGTVTVSDVVQWLGASSASGALEIVWNGSADGLVVTSRTYTTRGFDSGTLGQSIDAAGSDRLGTTSVITGLRSDQRFRTNVGLVNGGTGTIGVDLVLLAPDGRQLASSFVTLPPKSQMQSSAADLFPGVSSTSLGVFTVQATASVPSMLAYGSVIDNQSGDPIFVSGR